MMKKFLLLLCAAVVMAQTFPHRYAMKRNTATSPLDLTDLDSALMFKYPLRRVGDSLTLAKSGVVAGTYGDATHVPQFTVDSFGVVKSVTNVTISGGGGGGGTVTSVGLALPTSVFSVSGSPVIGAGTLAGAFTSQGGNTVFAAPNGSSGVPTFRAFLPGDISFLTDSITAARAYTLARIHDTSLVLRSLIAAKDSVRASHIADTVRNLNLYAKIAAVHDTANMIREYALDLHLVGIDIAESRIHDSLIANSQQWVTSAGHVDSARASHISDSAERAGYADSAIALRGTYAGNYVLATPDGTSGKLTPRALVGNDLPIVPVSKGGTGLSVTSSFPGNLRWNNSSFFIDTTTYFPRAGGYINGPVTFSTDANYTDFLKITGANNLYMRDYPGGTYGVFSVHNNPSTLAPIFRMAPEPGASTVSLEVAGSMTGTSFVRAGGLSTQFLKADGSVDATAYAAAGSLANYLPLSGGSSSTNALTGDLWFTDPAPSGGSGVRGIYGTVGTNDFWRIVGGATASNSGYLEIATADNAAEPIYVRQYPGPGVFAGTPRTLTLLDAAGNTVFPGSVMAGGLVASLRSGGSTVGAIYGDQVTPSSTNYSVRVQRDGSRSFLNGTSAVGLDVNNSDVLLAEAAQITAYQKLKGTSAAFSGSVTVDQLYALNNGNGKNLQIGDDLWIGDINQPNTSQLSGTVDAKQAYLKFGNNGPTIGYDGSLFRMPGAIRFSSNIGGQIVSGWGSTTPAYCKIGTATINGQYGSASGRCRFIYTGDNGAIGNGRAHSGTICFRMKQQSSMSSSLDVFTLWWEGSTNLDQTQAFALKTTDNSSLKQVDIYLRVDEGYDGLHYLWEETNNLSAQTGYTTTNPGSTYTAFQGANLDLGSSSFQVLSNLAVKNPIKWSSGGVILVTSSGYTLDTPSEGTTYLVQAESAGPVHNYLFVPSGVSWNLRSRDASGTRVITTAGNGVDIYGMSGLLIAGHDGNWHLSSE